MTLPSAFELEWVALMTEWEQDFNTRHTTKIGRWFFRPDYLDYSSIEYRLFKSIAELFFFKGQNSEARRISRENGSHNPVKKQSITKEVTTGNGNN